MFWEWFIFWGVVYILGMVYVLGGRLDLRRLDDFRFRGNGERRECENEMKVRQKIKRPP